MSNRVVDLLVFHEMLRIVCVRHSLSVSYGLRRYSAHKFSVPTCFSTGMYVNIFDLAHNHALSAIAG